MYDIGKLTEIARLCSAIQANAFDDFMFVNISNTCGNSRIAMYNSKEFIETFPDYTRNDEGNYNALHAKIGDVDIVCIEQKEKPLP